MLLSASAAPATSSATTLDVMDDAIQLSRAVHRPAQLWRVSDAIGVWPLPRQSILRDWKTNLLAVSPLGNMLFVASDVYVHGYPIARDGLPSDRGLRTPILPDPAMLLPSVPAPCINNMRCGYYGRTPILCIVDMGGNLTVITLEPEPSHIYHISCRTNAVDVSAWSIGITPFDCADPYIAVGTNAHRVFLCRLDGRRAQIVAVEHDHNVPSVDVSWTGDHIATASIDAHVRVLDPRHPTRLAIGHPCESWGWSVRWFHAHFARPHPLALKSATSVKSLAHATTYAQPSLPFDSETHLLATADAAELARVIPLSSTSSPPPQSPRPARAHYTLVVSLLPSRASSHESARRFPRRRDDEHDDEDEDEDEDEQLLADDTDDADEADDGSFIEEDVDDVHRAEMEDDFDDEDDDDDEDDRQEDDMDDENEEDDDDEDGGDDDGGDGNDANNTHTTRGDPQRATLHRILALLQRGVGRVGRTPPTASSRNPSSRAQGRQPDHEHDDAASDRGGRRERAQGGSARENESRTSTESQEAEDPEQVVRAHAFVWHVSASLARAPHTRAGLESSSSSSAGPHPRSDAELLIYGSQTTLYLLNRDLDVLSHLEESEFSEYALPTRALRGAHRLQFLEVIAELGLVLVGSSASTAVHLVVVRRYACGTFALEPAGVLHERGAAPVVGLSVCRANEPPFDPATTDAGAAAAPSSSPSSSSPSSSSSSPSSLRSTLHAVHGTSALSCAERTWRVYVLHMDGQVVAYELVPASSGPDLTVVSPAAHASDMVEHARTISPDVFVTSDAVASEADIPSPRPHRRADDESLPSASACASTSLLTCLHSSSLVRAAHLTELW